MSRDVLHLGSKDHGRQLVSDHRPKESSVIDESRFFFYFVISNVMWSNHDEIITYSNTKTRFTCQ